MFLQSNNKQITSIRNFGTFKIFNVDQGAEIFFKRALITFISDNIHYHWYSFIMRFVCFGVFVGEGRIKEEFLYNGLFGRSNICYYAWSGSSERCLFD